MAGCRLAAQSHRVELLASTGAACFVDESWCDSRHIYAAAGARFAISSKWALQPEYAYANGPGLDRDHSLVANISRTFAPSVRVSPYWVAGAGSMYHRGPYGHGRELTFNTGFGFKIHISNRFFLAPEVRLGWNPFMRFGFGAGWTIK